MVLLLWGITLARRRMTQEEHDELKRQLNTCNRAIEYAEIFSDFKECKHCDQRDRAVSVKMIAYVREYESILDDPTKNTINDLLNAKVAYAQANICRDLAKFPDDVVKNKRDAIAKKEDILRRLATPIGEILR